jgi:hypothetical protein
MSEDGSFLSFTGVFNLVLIGNRLSRLYAQTKGLVLKLPAWLVFKDENLIALDTQSNS